MARYQAQRSERVTNLRHERVILDDLDRYLLPFVNGQHDHDVLVQGLLDGPVQQGLLHLQRDGQPIEEAAQRQNILSDGVSRRLQWLARAGLLES